MRGGVPVFSRATRERQLAQARGEAVRGGIACATAGVVVEPDVNASAEEGPHREHHDGRLEDDAGDGHDARARDRR